MSTHEWLRFWLLKRRSGPTKEAIDAVAEAEHERDETAMFVREVGDLVDQLRRHRQRNHFAPLVDEALRRRRIT